MFDPLAFNVNAFDDQSFEGLSGAPPAAPTGWVEPAPLTDIWVEQPVEA